jgi:hypothetical protein
MLRLVISTNSHFFSIIAANDALWRRMFEARWGTDLASHYSGTWRERFASRVFFLKAKTALPPVIPSPSAVTSVRLVPFPFPFALFVAGLLFRGPNVVLLRRLLKRKPVG